MSNKYVLKTSTPCPRQRGTFDSSLLYMSFGHPLPPPAGDIRGETLCGGETVTPSPASGGHSSLRTINICSCDTVSYAGQASPSATRRVGEQPDNLKVTRRALLPACRKTMSSRRNGVTEKSARSLNRFLPAVEMTNHELLQAGTAISTSGKRNDSLCYCGTGKHGLGIAEISNNYG